MKLEDKYSKHHILPRSRYWSSESCNLEILKNTTHRALHTLFQNQMIAEQLITTISLSEKALKEEVVERLIATLNQKNIHDPSDRYIDWAIR